MNVQPSAIHAALPPLTATGSEVWERVWRHRPSDAKDDALLAREYRGPRWRLMVERLTSSLGTICGLRTLELGSGRGDLSILLAEAGACVTLIDRSDRALHEARRRFDRLGLTAEYRQGDILDLPGDCLGQFDVTLSIGVLEHFQGEQRTRAIQSHHDTLRPGGLAIISVPHAWCPPYRLWKAYLELRGWWPYGMEIPFTHREIVKRARSAGFGRAESISLGLWQSIGDHWIKRLRGRGPDWSNRPSRLDQMMGLVLLLFAQRDLRDELSDDGGG